MLLLLPTFNLSPRAATLGGYGTEISRDKNTGKIESSEPGNSSSFNSSHLKPPTRASKLAPSPAELAPWMLRLRNVLPKTPQGVREAVR